LSDKGEEISLEGFTFFFHRRHCFVEFVQIVTLLLEFCLDFEGFILELGFWESGDGLATPLVAQRETQAYFRRRVAF